MSSDNIFSKNALSSRQNKEVLTEGNIIIKSIYPNKRLDRYAQLGFKKIHETTDYIEIGDRKFKRNAFGNISISENVLKCDNLSYEFKKILGINKIFSNQVNLIEISVIMELKKIEYVIKLQIDSKKSNEIFQKLNNMKFPTKINPKESIMGEQINFLKDRFSIDRP